MADVRVTTGSRSRVVGEPVGVSLNTFGLTRLEGITGEDLLPIVVSALEPSREQAFNDWPKETHASSESIRIEPDEVGEKHVRVALKVGGQQLIEDPRNVKHIDYAPYLEFNGSPSGYPPGILSYAFFSHQREMRDRIHEGVALLIQSRLG